MCHSFHSGKRKYSACGEKNILKCLFVLRLIWFHESFQILTLAIKIIIDFYKFEIQTYIKGKLDTPKKFCACILYKGLDLSTVHAIAFDGCLVTA